MADADLNDAAIPDGAPLVGTDRFYIMRDPTGSPLDRFIAADDAKTFMSGSSPVVYPLDDTRISGSGRTLFASAGTTNTKNQSGGELKLALVDVEGGWTPTSVSVGNLTTTATTGNYYLVMYNRDGGDGLPGTLAASWGPFPANTPGTVTLTSQTTPVPTSGRYWYGIWCDENVDGTLTIDGHQTSRIMWSDSDERKDSISIAGRTGAPGDLTGVTGFTASRFVHIPHAYGT